MRTKAISPLVAAVLLIAITLTLAGMIAFWAAAFVRERQVAWEERPILGECLDADFDIYSCSYDNVTGEMVLVLNNLRAVTLRNVTAWIFYDNNTIDSRALANLPGGRYERYTLTGISSNYINIQVRTHCPDVERETRC
jgi:flagellin-like protein